MLKVKWGFEIQFGLDYNYTVIFLLDYFGVNILDQLLEYDDTVLLEDEHSTISAKEWSEYFDRWLNDNGGDLDQWITDNVGILKSKLIKKIGLTQNLLINKLKISYDNFTYWDECPGELVNIINNEAIFNVINYEDFQWWINNWSEKLKSDTFDIYINVPLFNKKTTNIKLEYNLNISYLGPIS